MKVSIAESPKRLPELIRGVEDGETIVITHHSKPVAQITPASEQQQQVQWGTMSGSIRLLPGWDDPIDLDAL